MSERGQQLDPAFVLHRRPYGETSLIVDLFTLHHGHFSAVARGAARPRSQWQAELQPFRPLRTSWSGRQSLRTLRHAEATAPALALSGDRLYCGFYLNELLLRLLTEADPAPDLFSVYLDTLEQLAGGSAALEPTLRRFEYRLAGELGYGISWDRTGDTGDPVQPDRVYAFHPAQGVLADGHGPVGGISGEHLLALAADELDNQAVLKVAKRLMRSLVDHLLQGRPLHSRRLFARQGRSE
ncbi:MULTISPECIES: DNA repair protein RecO [Gammaproteobacteria]|uniref:DNA repair protein RecO n=1 Tax=Vreelandella halophila TaxID=86177 RepID=A0A9X4YBY2_9GAMM|nr:DNA repair protein RecO [Halospina sp. K52047b]KAA8978541.1 DNA repair protein RecO [Halospina sp. K52047b]MYL26415.1 DNA repair protein RecO [Halomonas utahensis]MYL73752.1 DNA repair protein RecO [Halomonas sp. 22501_18_FS]